MCTGCSLTGAAPMSTQPAGRHLMYASIRQRRRRRQRSCYNVIDESRTATVVRAVLVVVALSISVQSAAFSHGDHDDVDVIVFVFQSITVDEIAVLFNERYPRQYSNDLERVNSSAGNNTAAKSVSLAARVPCISSSSSSSLSSVSSEDEKEEDICSGSAAQDDVASSCTGSSHNECACPMGFKNRGICNSQRVEFGENVFAEKLRDAKKLESNYYFTDRKQMTDFFWIRTSGIKVNIGLQNVNIIPEYEDVNLGGDNEYMLNNPTSVEDKKLYTNIIQKYCRYPVPDHYIVTLELSKDRTTQAEVDVCTLDLYKRGKCPLNVYIGDEFLLRTLNEPCQSIGSDPDALNGASNSIVCTERTNLLSLFNLTPSTEHRIPDSSRSCQAALSGCLRCLQLSRCQAEFAGDAYRFTLQPVFLNLGQDFKCRLRRRTPQIIYQLWFYVSIPGTGFETPRIYRTFNSSPAVSDLSSAKFSSHFIRVEHNNGLELDENFLLHGRKLRSGRWIYSTRSIPVTASRADHFDLHTITSNTFAIQTQFQDSSMYSTATWVNESGCNKDTRNFVRVEDFNVSDSMQFDVDDLNVSIDTIDSQFRYQIKSTVNPPSLKFIIPESVSVIRWFFKERPVFLLFDESLHFTLSDWEASEWQLSISGRMTACPGYLAVTIDDWKSQEELFKYDFLISCPTTFHIKFYIGRLISSAERRDETFSIILDDAHYSYRSYINYVYANASQDVKLPNRNATRYSGKMRGMNNHFMLVFIAGFLLTLLLFVCAATEVKKIKRNQLCHNRLSIEGRLQIKHFSKSNVNNLGDIFKLLNTAYKCVLVFYFTLKLITRGLLTFTVLYLLLSVYFKFLFSGAFNTTVNIFHLQYRSKQWILERGILSVIDGELERISSTDQTARAAFEEQWRSLTSSIDRRLVLAESNAFNMDFSSTNATRFSDTTEAIERFRVDARIFCGQLKASIKTFRSEMKVQICPTINRFVDNVATVADNSWFLHPAALFNKSSAGVGGGRTALQHGGDENCLCEAVCKNQGGSWKMGFASFLGATQSETIISLNNKFFQRFDELSIDAYLSDNINSLVEKAGGAGVGGSGGKFGGGGSIGGDGERSCNKSGDQTKRRQWINVDNSTTSTVTLLQHTNSYRFVLSDDKSTKFGNSRDQLSTRPIKSEEQSDVDIDETKFFSLNDEKEEEENGNNPEKWMDVIVASFVPSQLIFFFIFLDVMMLVYHVNSVHTSVHELLTKLTLSGPVERDEKFQAPCVNSHNGAVFKTDATCEAAGENTLAGNSMDENSAYIDRSYQNGEFNGIGTSIWRNSNERINFKTDRREKKDVKRKRRCAENGDAGWKDGKGFRYCEPVNCVRKQITCQEWNCMKLLKFDRFVWKTGCIPFLLVISFVVSATLTMLISLLRNGLHLLLLPDTDGYFIAASLRRDILCTSRDFLNSSRPPSDGWDLQSDERLAIEELLQLSALSDYMKNGFLGSNVTAQPVNFSSLEQLYKAESMLQRIEDEYLSETQDGNQLLNILQCVINALLIHITTMTFLSIIALLLEYHLTSMRKATASESGQNCPLNCETARRTKGMSTSGDKFNENSFEIFSPISDVEGLARVSSIENFRCGIVSQLREGPTPTHSASTMFCETLV